MIQSSFVSPYQNGVITTIPFGITSLLIFEALKRFNASELVTLTPHKQVVVRSNLFSFIKRLVSVKFTGLVLLFFTIHRWCTCFY